jgi:hypothetical protein
VGGDFFEFADSGAEESGEEDEAAVCLRSAVAKIYFGVGVVGAL